MGSSWDTADVQRTVKALLAPTQTAMNHTLSPSGKQGGLAHRGWAGRKQVVAGEATVSPSLLYQAWKSALHYT